MRCYSTRCVPYPVWLLLAVLALAILHLSSCAPQGRMGASRSMQEAWEQGQLNLAYPQQESLKEAAWARNLPLPLLEDSLQKLAWTMVKSPSFFEREQANVALIKTLGQNLRRTETWFYDFDSLISLAVLRSPDQKFRIINWHLAEDAGTYRYYGVLQYFYNDSLHVVPLFDHTLFFDDAPTKKELGPKEWYGAHYYSIIPGRKKRQDYYVLLGWKGHNPALTQKVIETLYFDEGAPRFGLPVLYMGETRSRRVIFKFTAQASMLLRYMPRDNEIVMDHLSPPNKAAAGAFELYGPDLSYDVLKYKRGVWRLQEDVPLRNAPHPNDKLWNDPTQ